MDESLKSQYEASPEELARRENYYKGKILGHLEDARWYLNRMGTHDGAAKINALIKDLDLE